MSIESERKKQLYKTRKTTGLCVRCGGVARTRRVHCVECAAHMSRHTVNRYKRLNKERSKAYFTIRSNNTASSKRAHARHKAAAMNAYGGECDCCGEPRLAFLTLDHVNNDGAEHRKRPTYRQSDFYRQLKAAGYPNDPALRVLCFNCNSGRQVNGGVCPHEQERMTALRVG